MKAVKNISELIDSLLILLNCSATYSVLPYVLFHIYSRGVFIILIGLINCYYIWKKWGNQTQLPDNKLFYLYCTLMLWNSYAGLYSGTGFISSLIYLFCNSTFFLILYNLFLNYRIKYSQKESLWLILRGYVWLIIGCVISVIAIFFIIKIGIDPYGNNINTKYDLFKDNVDTLGSNYYSPFHLGILLGRGEYVVRIPFFSEKGIICGFYHEPHILTFLVFPCLFIMWAFAKNNGIKVLIFIIGLFILLIASSTTNVITALGCLIVAMFFSKKGRIALIPLISLILIVVLIIGLENTDLFFLLYKLEDGGGSRTYSENTLVFAFSPKTLVGSNILSTTFIHEIGSATRDAGLINIILNIMFLIGVYIKIGKMLFSSRFNCLLGVGALYFMIHSMKTNTTTYTASILTLIIFLISYTVYTPKLKNIISAYDSNKKNYIE